MGDSGIRYRCPWTVPPTLICQMRALRSDPQAVAPCKLAIFEFLSRKVQHPILKRSSADGAVLRAKQSLNSLAGALIGNPTSSPSSAHAVVEGELPRRVVEMKAPPALRFGSRWSLL